MNQATENSPPASPPQGASHKDLTTAMVLVVLNGAAGFFGFTPETQSSTIAATVATISITVCFFLRQAWARHAAILVAFFGIIVSVLDLGTGAEEAPKAILWIQLVIAGLTAWWLLRPGVKAWFPYPFPPAK